MSQVQREFSSQQIVRLLQSLGSDCHGNVDSTQPLIFQTVCHNHDHGSFKLWYYPDSCRFHCYTQCGDNFDAYELVMRSRECSFSQSVEYIEEILQLAPSKAPTGFFDSAPIENSDWLTRYCEIKNVHAQDLATDSRLPNSLVDLYSKVYPVEWLADSVTPAAIDCFNIRFDITDNEIIIPHYNIDGELVGIRSRSYNQRKLDNGGKYMPTMLEGHDFRHTLRYHLYGLDKVKNTVKKTGKIILFEAEKSVLQSYSYYGESSFAVAVCGSNISSQQRDLILSLGVREVFLAFDKEYHEAFTSESDRYAEKILHLANMFSPYVTTYVLWDTEGMLGYKDSPSDHGQQVLEYLMKHKFEVETEKEKNDD